MRSQREEWAGPEQQDLKCSRGDGGFCYSGKTCCLHFPSQSLTITPSSYPGHFSDISSKKKIIYIYTTIKETQGTRAPVCKQKTDSDRRLPRPGEDGAASIPQALPAALTAPREGECLGLGRPQPRPSPSPFANLGSDNGGTQCLYFQRTSFNFEK